MKSHKNICRIVIIFILSIVLGGCQKKINIVMSAEPDSYVQSLNELEVVDGNYQETLDKCLERLEQLEDKESIRAADIYSIMGGIYAEYAYDEEKARNYLNKAIEIHENNGDKIRLAIDYSQMSKIYLYIGGDIEEGLEYTDKAEHIFKEYSEDALARAANLSNKGSLQLDGEQYEEALISFNEAQEIYNRRQFVDIKLFLNIGRVYMRMQEYDLAEEQVLEAIQLLEYEDDMYTMAEAKLVLGNVYYSMEKQEQALECYMQALEFYRTSKFYTSEAALININISSLYNSNNDDEKALEYAIKACQTVEEYPDVVSEDRKTRYKERLSRYYGNWSGDETEEGYEAWYEAVVINGEDWITQ